MGSATVNQWTRGRMLILLTTVALGGAALTGCSSGAVADVPASAPPTSDGKPAGAEGTPNDAAIAATCAGVSVIETTLANARQDLRLGTINADQYVALVESAYTGYRSVAAGARTQRGLEEELGAIVKHIEANPDTVTGARFDPLNEGYREVLYPLLKACERNVSETYVFSTTGG